MSPDIDAVLNQLFAKHFESVVKEWLGTLSKDRITIVIVNGQISMHDIYTHNKAIAVGPSSGASGTFVDNSSQVAAPEERKTAAGDSDEQPGHASDPGGVLAPLKWAMDVGREISAEVVAKMIAGSLGLPR